MKMTYYYIIITSLLYHYYVIIALLFQTAKTVNNELIIMYHAFPMFTNYDHYHPSLHVSNRATYRCISPMLNCFLNIISKSGKWVQSKG